MVFLSEQDIYSEGFGFVPKAALKDKRLNIVAKTIYSYICSCTGGGNENIPNKTTICNDLVISRSTLHKYLKQLKDYGYLSC